MTTFFLRACLLLLASSLVILSSDSINTPQFPSQAKPLKHEIRRHGTEHHRRYQRQT